jgi:hypothetical protein
MQFSVSGTVTTQKEMAFELDENYMQYATGGQQEPRSNH